MQVSPVTTPDVAEIISHHVVPVYLALDNTCHCFTAVDGAVTCITVPAFHLYLVAHVQEATDITIRILK